MKYTCIRTIRQVVVTHADNVDDARLAFVEERGNVQSHAVDVGDVTESESKRNSRPVAREARTS